LGSYKVHFFNHPAVLPAGFFHLWLVQQEFNGVANDFLYFCPG
jgi:hypothetical protein